jgi:TRAP transporter TAXI family solute receptor
MLRKTLAVLAFAMVALGPVLAAAQTEIRWGTSRVGSSGHRAVTNLVQVIQNKVPNYRFTVQPTPGAILTVKGYANGDFEGYYGSDIAFYELANNINRFKGFKEQAKRQPVQSFWTFTIEQGVAVHARDKDKIKSWRDLSGQRVFTGPRPWDTRAQLERAFSVLGVEHDYMEVDTKTAGSLLEQGRFKAFGVYSNAEATTAPWITETTLQTDWAALNPTPEEIEILEKAGMRVAEVDTSVFGKTSTPGAKVALLPFYYGLHLGLEVPEDDLYNILKVVEANLSELAQADKAFKQIAADMPGMQVRGVEAAVDLVEIHPGLAKYMREKGVWQAKWDSRVAKVN